MSVSSPLGMVLPEHDPSTGEVHRTWSARWRDSRVPAVGGLDAAPRVVGHYRRSEGTCEQGRHLFDAIEDDTADPRTSELLGDEFGERWVRFRLTLTCVRCGIIERLGGLRDQEDDRSRPTAVSAVPLRAGAFRAQQIDRGSDWGRSAGDLTTWTVHEGDNPHPVGVITWGSTPRGRRYFVGRLDAWPEGSTVEAPTAAACLRKIARSTTDALVRPEGGGDR